MTKMWTRKGEWVSYASCGGGRDIFTTETLTDDEIEEVQRTCGICRVRPECIQTALDEKWCSVIVAGIPLPGPPALPGPAPRGPDARPAPVDVSHEKQLYATYDHLRATLPAELEARGEDI